MPVVQSLHPDHDSRGHFRSGNTAWLRKQAAKRKMVAELQRELGRISTADHALLVRAVDLLHSKPRSPNDQTRALNVADRLLRSLRQKYAKPERLPTLKELGL
jgi:hypothetical protein